MAGRSLIRPWGNNYDQDHLSFKRQRNVYEPPPERSPPIRGWGVELLRLVGIISIVVGATIILAVSCTP